MSPPHHLGDEAQDLLVFQEKPLDSVRDHLLQTRPQDPGDAFFANISALALKTASPPKPVPWFRRLWASASRPYLVIASTAATAAAILLFTWLSTPSQPAPSDSPTPTRIAFDNDPSQTPPSDTPSDLDPDTFGALDELNADELTALSQSLSALSPTTLHPASPLESEDELYAIDYIDNLDADELASLQASLLRLHP